MSKLIEFKKRSSPSLSLSDAQKYLTNTLKVEVTLSDIYEFFLNEQLVISVGFYGVIAAAEGYIHWGESLKDAPLVELDVDPRLFKDKDYVVAPDNYCFFNKDLNFIYNTYDLSMYGKEYLDIEKLYQESIGNKIHKSNCIPLLDSVILKHGDQQFLVKTLDFPSGLDEEGKHLFMKNAHDEDFRNCDSLSELNYQFVIKTSEITRFILSVDNEKPLSTKEKNSFLIVIDALCRKAGIDINAKSASKCILEATQLNGISLSKGTIDGMIKKIRTMS